MMNHDALVAVVLGVVLLVAGSMVLGIMFAMQPPEVVRLRLMLLVCGGIAVAVTVLVLLGLSWAQLFRWMGVS